MRFSKHVERSWLRAARVPSYGISSRRSANFRVRSLGLGLCLLASASLGCGKTGGTSSDSEPATPPSVQAGSTVVAELDGRTLTLAEVDRLASASNAGVFQELYNVRKRSIDDWIESQLIERAAKEKGVPADVLLRQETEARQSPVAEADVEKFFKEHEAQLGGQKLEALAPRIRSFLAQQSEATARSEYMEALKSKASFRFFLEPPRANVQIGDNERVLGSADAKVSIVEYSDFQCPFCSRVNPTLEQIRETYGDQVRLIYRDYPLPIHPAAKPAAEAGRCAHDQGKFWEYHDLLFSNQSKLESEDLIGYAEKAGLDATAFKSCIEGGTHRTAVEESFAQGKELGVRGTPSFFINGRFVNGAVPFDEFKDVIDDELQRRTP